MDADLLRSLAIHFLDNFSVDERVQCTHMENIEQFVVGCQHSLVRYEKEISFDPRGHDIFEEQIRRQIRRHFEYPIRYLPYD